MSLDLALGGGYALGRIIELRGYESSGKTTLALTACRNIQEQTGKAVLYIDRENAIDMDYVEAIGVNISPEMFILCQPGVAEECLEIIREAIKSKSIGAIVLDSVAAMFPKCYLEADVGDAKMGVLARLMATWLPGVIGDIKKNNQLMIFINQYRDKIGVVYGSPKTTPGGKALGFYSSQVLDIAKSGVVGDRGEEVANHIKVKVKRIRLHLPCGKLSSTFVSGKELIRLQSCYQLASNETLLRRQGRSLSTKERHLHRELKRQERLS